MTLAPLPRAPRDGVSGSSVVAGRRRLRGSGVDLAVAGNLLAFGIAVLLSNGYDWDAFLSFNEVDRRSWVLDLRPPLWSYQLCAGVTRIGDPQAFGLSPLFLLVVLFGSFWGSKLAVIASAGAGLYFSTKLLALFAAAEEGIRVPHTAILTLATLFVMSNFFLWHLLVGHFSFVSIYFALGIIYYTLEGYLHGLDRRSFAIGTLVAWQHFSGGFFQSTAYFLVPFFLAFSVYLATAGVVEHLAARSPWRALWRRLGRAVSFQACGLLLASYKWIAVWQQQQLHPRTLDPANEVNSLTQLVAYQLLPALGPDWPIPIESEGHLDLHEYSAFSLLPIALALLAGRSILARDRRFAGGRAGRGARPALGWLVALYASLSVLLLLGNFSAHAPFTLLNATLFQNSVRVVGRYGVGLALSLAMACALMVRWLGPPALGPKVCLVLLLLSILNLSAFSWIFDVRSTLQTAFLPDEARQEMSRFVSVAEVPVEFGHELEAPRMSQMYAALRIGDGVINCYSPLPRPQIDGWPREARVRLIDVRYGSPGRRCVAESYYTQNEIRIGASCPPAVCLNVGALNPRDPLTGTGVRYLAHEQRFCRIAKPRAPARERGGPRAPTRR